MSFILRETFASMGRAKLSLVFSLFSFTVGVLLIQFALVTLVFSEVLKTSVQQQFTMSLFLQNDTDDEDINTIKSQIQNKPYIASLSFVSKDQAANSFIKETGEDFREILEYNPLPASFVVTLKEAYLENSRVESIRNEFENISGIEDVRYKSNLIDRLLAIIHNAQLYIWVITGLLALVAIYIVYATLRLIIHNRHKEIETMKLVGASIFTIKAPIILSGLIIGILANVISTGLLLGMYVAGVKFLGLPRITFSFHNYILLASLFLGPFIGIACSFLATRKITMKVA